MVFPGGTSHAAHGLVAGLRTDVVGRTFYAENDVSYETGFAHTTPRQGDSDAIWAF